MHAGDVQSSSVMDYSLLTPLMLIKREAHGVPALLPLTGEDRTKPNTASLAAFLQPISTTLGYIY